MKKFITSIALACVLALSLLFTACSGFFAEEAVQIASITNELMADGTTKITITYVDDAISPDIFYIPRGQEGDEGKDGNGISEITYERAESNDSTVINIKYTDPTLDPVSFVVPDGRTVVGIETYTDEILNEEYIIFAYNDGTFSERVYLPRGQSGIGIKEYKQTVNNDKSVDTTFILDDGREVKITIPAPQEGNGIESMMASVSEDGKNYIITVKYTNGETQDLELPCPEEPNKWMTGEGEPSDFVGENGDFFFDVYHNNIYLKEGMFWTLIVDFDDDDQKYDVSFNLNDDNDASMPAGSLKVYKIQRGSYFESEVNGYGGIPIPTRDGYTFMGWYTSKIVNPAVTGQFTSLTPVFDHLTLYAYWVENAA